MCIVPFGTIYMLFNIDMGNHPRAQNFHALQLLAKVQAGLFRLQSQHRAGNEEVNHQRAGVHDGRNHRACHHSRVKAKPLRADRQQTADNHRDDDRAEQRNGNDGGNHR